MNKKLYIGNLSLEVTEQDLNHNFSTVGKVVSAAIIKDAIPIKAGLRFCGDGHRRGCPRSHQAVNGGDLRARPLSSAKPKKRIRGKEASTAAVAPDQDLLAVPTEEAVDISSADFKEPCTPLQPERLVRARFDRMCCLSNFTVAQTQSGSMI